MKRFGGMVSFRMRQGRRGRRGQGCAAVQLWTLGESLGGVESLIEHPAPDDPRVASPAPSSRCPATSSACPSASRTSTTSSPTCERRSTSTADPAAPAPMTILTVDFGSTFTKAALIADDGTVLGTASTPTTGTQGRGWRHPRRLPRAARPSRRASRRRDVHACSSAGGGLRLAVVGYERDRHRRGRPPRRACPRAPKSSTSPTGR